MRKLIFGSGKKNKKESKKGSKPSDDTDHKDKAGGRCNESTSESEVVVTDIPANTNQASAPGHGRLPHSAYTNTIEHQLLISGIKAGDPCSMQCGGKFYSPSPGIIVRVTGQNLAMVHKYWIQRISQLFLQKVAFLFFRSMGHPWPIPRSSMALVASK